MLTRWHLGTAQKIADDMSATSTFRATTEDVEKFAQQLRLNGLLRCRAADIIQAKKAAKNNQADIASRFSNSLLFMRLPLMHPQDFLDKTAFLIAPFFSRGFWYMLLAGLLGALYLIGRQWDSFVASLSSMTNFSGAVAISVMLVLSKSAHELAHGYAARRYGAMVPTMGIAFIIFWPLLYTETSNAWALADRRARIVVAAAGVAAELAIAILCFMAWPFLDPGPLRDAAGFAATSLVVLSVLFNANPLMRFDGYFILSEALGIENIQPRSFELLKWHLRRFMAGIALPYPEIMLTVNERRGLLIYGIASAAYRIALYSGIVYAINALLFPAVALPLSAVIIMSSLLKPTFKEINQWFRLAVVAHGPLGLLRPALICTLLVAPLFIPWRSTVQVPVLIAAGDGYDIFAPEPSRIGALYIKEGDRVTKGAKLIDLDAPDTAFKLSQAQRRAAVLNRKINQQLTQINYHNALKTSERELAQLGSEISGLIAKRQQLTLQAPISGTVTMLERSLRVGLWVPSDQPLAQITAKGAPVIFGYAEERDIGFILPGAQASIWFEGEPARRLTGYVEAVYPQALKAIKETMMSSINGGPLTTRQHPQRNELIPELALYKIRIKLDAASAASLPMLKTRGYCKIETRPRNLINRFIARVIGLWRRELG